MWDVVFGGYFPSSSPLELPFSPIRVVSLTFSNPMVPRSKDTLATRALKASRQPVPAQHDGGVRLL